MNYSDNLGTILYPDFDQDVIEEESRIIRQSLKNLNSHNNSKRSLNREEYNQVNCNDKTSASTHMTSEYGMLNGEKHHRGKFLYKNLPFQGKQAKMLKHDYSAINP